jgi:hypothetical protein
LSRKIDAALDDSGNSALSVPDLQQWSNAEMALGQRCFKAVAL